MPKKMTPKSQAKKIKTLFLQYPFLTNKYTILSFNCIMRIYSNAYDYAIYCKLLVFLCALSIQ